MIRAMNMKYERARAAAEAIRLGIVAHTCRKALKKLGLSWFKTRSVGLGATCYSGGHMVCGTFKDKTICTGFGPTAEDAWRNLLQNIFTAAAVGSMQELFIKVDVSGVPAPYKKAMAAVETKGQRDSN